jgi:hypothetical protein
MLAQKQPPFKECVIAHWSSALAPIILGTKLYTEAADSPIYRRVVGEHSINRRRCIARCAGGDGKEDAGISSDKTGEKPVRRKSKVS